MRGHNSDRFALRHIASESGIHEIGPNAAAAPQKASGQNVMPSYVVDIARRTREERGRLLAIELHIPEVEDVEQFDIGIFRNERMITA